jgi:hypothetical protein
MAGVTSAEPRMPAMGSDITGGQHIERAMERATFRANDFVK